VAGDVDLRVRDLIERSGRNAGGAVGGCRGHGVGVGDAHGQVVVGACTEPPPLARPWHSLQLTAFDTCPWKESDLLQALPEVFASAAWQTTQSLPTTELEPWFIHWTVLVEVLPRFRLYVTLLWVGAFAAGVETAWHTTHAVGCDARLGWNSAGCHRVETIGVLALLDSAAV